MDYFAYGSNIRIIHFFRLLAQHCVDPDDVSNPRQAILHGYRLRTNYFSAAHQAGACNIEPDRDAHVEGVVLSVTERVRAVLRIKEGFPQCYDEIEVEVETSRGVVPAFAYIVTPAQQLTVDLPVTPEYRQRILDGARMFNFSAGYQRRLRRTLRALDCTLAGRE